MPYELARDKKHAEIKLNEFHYNVRVSEIFPWQSIMIWYLDYFLHNVILFENMYITCDYSP